MFTIFDEDTWDTWATMVVGREAHTSAHDRRGPPVPAAVAAATPDYACQTKLVLSMGGFKLS